MSNFFVKDYGGPGVTKNLTEIFAPYSSGSKSNPTNYKYYSNSTNTYVDLSEIFAPYDGISSAATTRYIVNNNDLNMIFKKIVPVAPVIQPITNISYKTATITWTITDTPSSYEFNQSGDPSYFTATTSTSYVSTNLINGNSYTFTVTAVYPDGSRSTSVPLNYQQPATSTYFIVSPLADSLTIEGTNTVYTFTTTNTYYFTNSSSTAINFSFLLVGGGGGGGGGHAKNNEYSGAAGGGGGGIYQSNFNISQSTTVTLSVGQGGNGGLGGTSTVGDTDGNQGSDTTLSGGGNTIIGYGGGGGQHGAINTIPYGGSGGNGNGGDGGRGGYMDEITDGNASTYYNPPTYSGGGGGGGNGRYVGKAGGGDGGNGYGGVTLNSDLYTNTNANAVGQNGIAYGGGGGGGGLYAASSSVTFGGNGGAGQNGIIIITIPN